MAFFGGKKKKESPPGSDEKLSDAEVCASPDAPLEFSDKNLAAAKKWFKQAQKLTGDRNYEYAIESYLTGLKFWPEAVEEGHQPLRAAAHARRETGGKKPGTMEVMKRSMSGKDPLQALLNAEYLWAHDPTNISYMQSMVKSASKAKCEKTLLFIGPIYFEAAKNQKKVSKDPFVLLRKVYGEMAERCERRGDLKSAIEFFQGALTVVDILRQVAGASIDLGRDLKDLATKITIIKGKYDSGGDFRESIKDSDAQKDMHDRERMVMDEDRLDQLIAEAQADWQANPQVSAKLLRLTDLLCRVEGGGREEEAIKLLEDEYAASANYGYEVRAGDIRMRILRRKVRQTVADGDKQAAQEAQVEQRKFELQVFKERVQHYPTDNKVKFEYGKRLVRSRSFDEAIPVLQEAQRDPKNRLMCLSLIGRSFFEKGFHSQAIGTYNQAIESHEATGDDISKELFYWLGRAYEMSGETKEAEKAFGQVLQWDYNFRDVRDRLAGSGE